MVLAADIVAMDVADARDQRLWRLERPAVTARVPVRMPEVPACHRVARDRDLQQFLVRIADALPWLIGARADLQLHRDADLRDVVAAPVVGPREK